MFRGCLGTFKDKLRTCSPQTCFSRGPKSYRKTLSGEAALRKCLGHAQGVLKKHIRDLLRSRSKDVHVQEFFWSCSKTCSRRFEFMLFRTRSGHVLTRLSELNSRTPPSQLPPPPGFPPSPSSVDATTAVDVSALWSIDTMRATSSRKRSVDLVGLALFAPLRPHF